MSKYHYAKIIAELLNTKELKVDEDLSDFEYVCLQAERVHFHLYPDGTWK